MSTHITDEHRRAFEALTSGRYQNFCLFSCEANGHPAAIIAAVTVQPPPDGALRAMIDYAIGQRLTIHDEQVARHLKECASLSSAIEDFERFETYVAYEARLTRQHDRKLLFGNRIA